MVANEMPTEEQVDRLIALVKDTVRAQVALTGDFDAAWNKAKKIMKKKVAATGCTLNLGVVCSTSMYQLLRDQFSS